MKLRLFNAAKKKVQNKIVTFSPALVLAGISVVAIALSLHSIKEPSKANIVINNYYILGGK